MTTQSSALSPQSSALSPRHSALSPQHSILVTGGAGFIGSNFVHYWIKNYPEDRVVILDALTYAGNLANLEPVAKHPHYRFVQGDIRDYDLAVDLLQEEKIDTIVHFAAESHVDRSIHGPDAFVDTNIIGTHTLLKAAKKVWLDLTNEEIEVKSEKDSSQHSVLSPQSSRYKFHHVSTDEVYGSLGPDDPAFSETTAYAPNSPYAASKAGSDYLVRSYFKTYGLPMTISNCSNNYGPYQFPEKLIPLLILNCLAGKPLPIYGDGLNIRDWLHVDDHCRGIDLVLKKGAVGQTYNIGGNCEKTNIEVVEEVCRLMDELHPLSPQSPVLSPQSSVLTPHSSLISHVKDRAGHDRRYAINAQKITSELGYIPAESFESGLRKTVEWYLANRDWCLNVMDGNYREWLEKNYAK
ncbi:dTDP-glucose 4,6-dehydratase [Thermodesulfobacteriota bacterium]